MRLFKLLFIGSMILLFTACGGSDSGSDNSTGGSEDISTTAMTIIDSGSSPRYGRQYDLKGDNGIYYKTAACRLTGIGKTDFNVYENGQVSTSYNLGGNNYSSTCYTTQAYKTITLTNTTDVNASWIDDHTFYDNNTKIFYEHPNLITQSYYRLVEMTNDGMTAIIDKGNSATILVELDSAYKKINFDTIQITPHTPLHPFFQGTSDEIMEKAFINNSQSNKRYDFKGYLFNYEHSGCKFGNSQRGDYVIFNDGILVLKSDAGEYNSCIITHTYQITSLTNTTDINASWVDNYTFYDNNTKIFYEHPTMITNSTYRLVEITNDGMTAVVDMGSSETVVSLVSTYKKIN